ncbi:NADH:flavin oxidoreductase/NADH oxidase [Sphaerisporangium viridialbum]|uniref:NADH:flavin oxidoreductase/NADH oxidase n=1 Tax=Sphaerisporangium viridialbum TaxID=46189 RepID=UPI003C734EDB
MSTSHLFTPLTVRGATFRNRAWVSPMCQYSAVDGVVGDWHLVHLGSLASGGAGLIVAESTGVTPAGRISPHCAGLWSDEQAEAWARVVRYAHSQKTPLGIQLSHAGRKGSTSTPWTGEVWVPPAEGGWPTLAPSAVPYGDLPAPAAMTLGDIDATRRAFAASAVRALHAGFDVVELHAAHGYLLHEFLSPLSNRRQDRYGGSYENRMRFPLEVAAAVREEWPADRPLFVRVSVTDWVPGGWDLESSIGFARRLAGLGVDLVDCSSGGLVPDAEIPADGAYQSDLAHAVREGAGVRTAAVGRITEPEQAEEIIGSAKADAVLLGRAMLRDPRWALRAASAVGAAVPWPVQYERAKPGHRRIDSQELEAS